MFFSSYVIKNTVFWICEDSPQELFTNDLLLDRLLGSLGFLLRSVDKETLPCYFVPERNLLHGKICAENKYRIIDMLSNMLSEGPLVALRINEIHREVLRIRRNLVMALLTGHFRNLAEILYLKRREDSFRHFILAAIRYISSAVYKYIDQNFFSSIQHNTNILVD